jgi:hypothetical protein
MYVLCDIVKDRSRRLLFAALFFFFFFLKKKIMEKKKDSFFDLVTTLPKFQLLISLLFIR